MVEVDLSGVDIKEHDTHRIPPMALDGKITNH